MGTLEQLFVFREHRAITDILIYQTRLDATHGAWATGHARCGFGRLASRFAMSFFRACKKSVTGLLLGLCPDNGGRFLACGRARACWAWFRHEVDLEVSRTDD
jgi:hypothetical protein